MQRWTSEPLAFPHYSEGGFSRADLEFEDLLHDGQSFSVALYLNNPEVAEDAGDARENGYAGTLVVFGHGDCWGDAGHCEVPNDRGPFDRRAPHPLEPINLTLEITEALARVQEADALNGHGPGLWSRPRRREPPALRPPDPGRV